VLKMWVQFCHPSHQFRLRHDSPPPWLPRIYRAGRCRRITPMSLKGQAS
jgi:hypothetical protein